MKAFTVPAIIFGGDAVTALGVMRNLARNGIDVYYVTDRKDEAVFSRYCKRAFVVPKIQDDISTLSGFLNTFQKRVYFGAVAFPGSDLFALNLSSLTKEIGGAFELVLPGIEILETLVNKKKFYRSLDEHGISHPRTYFPRNLADINEIGRSCSYPVCVKPSISPLFAREFRKKGFVATSGEELRKYCQLALERKIDFVVQEIVPGTFTDFICGYLNEAANRRGIFAYRGLRHWPLGFGNSVFAESIPLSSVRSIAKVAVDYLRSIRYHGLFDAEFKSDPRGDDYKFLEVNARCWWQNSLPTRCGINLVLMAYLDKIGEKISFPDSYQVGCRWIHFLNDFRSAGQMLRDGKMTVPEWVSSLYGPNEWAFFSADDVLPSLLGGIFNIRKLVEANVAQTH